MVPIKMMLDILNHLKDIWTSMWGGGDFSTVLNIHLDKKHGRSNTHRLSRQAIHNIIDKFSFVDSWRDKNPSLRQFT